MTAINDISDLVRVLQDDPAWAEAVRSVLLSQELLKMPEEFANFARTVKENSEAVNRRLEHLESDVSELKIGQARLESDVSELKIGQARLESDVSELKIGQARLESDVSELKIGQARLESDVSELKIGQARLESDVSELKIGQARLESDVSELKIGQAQMQTSIGRIRGEIGNLAGSDFQRRAVAFAVRIARRDFSMRRATLAHHANRITDSALSPMLDEAVENASVPFSEDDAANVEQADAVVAGKDQNGSDAYLVVEASITVMEKDVARARERADLLELAGGIVTEAVVIGTAITEEAARQSREQRVAFVQFDPMETGIAPSA